MIYAFFYGIILAVSLIAPLGVQNMFIFNQGAEQKHFLHAMPSVLTALVCDSILIITAVLGVSVIVLEIPLLKIILFVIGFCFLIYMGFVSWNSRTSKVRDNKKPLSAKKQVIFSASVSLLNPHALLDTIGVIGTSSLAFFGNEKLVFTSACIFTSGCWFFGLSVAGHFLHNLDKTGSWFRKINKLSALIIWAVAFYIGYLLIKELIWRNYN